MEPLDADDFDTGDGTADYRQLRALPPLRRGNVIFLDPGSGASQQYVEDCRGAAGRGASSCHDADGHANVDVTQLDE
jgi:hypothetical protein